MVCLPVPPLPQESKQDYSKRPEVPWKSQEVARLTPSSFAAFVPPLALFAVKSFQFSGFAKILNRKARKDIPPSAQRTGRHQYFTIAANDLGSRLAPPTSAPSISLSLIKAFAFSGFTEPP